MIYITTDIRANVMKKNENYKYNIIINQWAIIEFLKTSKIKIENCKDLKEGHLVLLSAIVDFCAIDNSDLLKKNIDNDIYTYLTDKFLLNNLPLMRCKNRQLKNRLKVLEKYGFILRYIENNEKRYITVSNRFLRLLNKGNIKVSPKEFLYKYHRKEFNELRTLYADKLNKPQFDKILNKFSDVVEFDQYMSKNYSMFNLLERFKNYLNECLNDK